MRKAINLDLNPAVPSSAEMQELYALALRFADTTREIILTKVREKLAVEQKADRSFVTNLDKFVEDRFRTLIAQDHQGAGVIGEEYGRTNEQAEFQWVVDPIDGTAELVAGVPTFGTVIGLLYHGAPILGVFDHPLMGLRVAGGVGLGCFRNDVKVTLPTTLPEKIRVHLPPAEAFVRRDQEIPGWYGQLLHRYPSNRTYFTCLSLASASSGGVHGSLEWDQRIWDFSPASVLVREAGGAFELLHRYIDDEGEERFCFALGAQPVVKGIKELVPPFTN